MALHEWLHIVWGQNGSLLIFRCFIFSFKPLDQDSRSLQIESRKRLQVCLPLLCCSSRPCSQEARSRFGTTESSVFFIVEIGASYTTSLRFSKAVNTKSSRSSRARGLWLFTRCAGSAAAIRHCLPRWRAQGSCRSFSRPKTGAWGGCCSTSTHIRRWRGLGAEH